MSNIHKPKYLQKLTSIWYRFVLKPLRISTVTASLALLGLVSSSLTGISTSTAHAQTEVPFDQKPTEVYTITGHLPDLKFKLNRAGNQTLDNEQLRGKVVLVFFGYASCPDICPTTMAELSDLMASLSKKQANEIQIVFISVDPHRDTPDVLQAYVDAFDNGAIGVTGDAQQIAEIARRYRVSYQIEKPKPGADPNNYEVMHAQGVYVFDQEGKARLLATNLNFPEEFKQKLSALLSST